MNRTLYVATGNPGKLRDFAAAAAAHGIAVEPLPGLTSISAPEEDQPAFEGNARLKAAYYSRFAPGELVLADDSGLEVDALDGAPGVRSARFAADAGFGGTVSAGTTDERNNLYLLSRLLFHRAPLTARYRCVLAAALDGACLLAAEGSVEGEILRQPAGTGGFGYDPLFYLPALGKTMAEIDLATKDRLSHRGCAFRSLLAKLGRSIESTAKNAVP